MRHRQLAAILSVSLLLVLAGCGGLGDSPAGGPDDESLDTGAEDAEAAAEPEADTDSAFDSSASEPRVQNRQLIRTGEIRLQVDDAEAASAEIRELADERGGFVGASSQQVHERHNETWRTGTVVVRVPSDTFEASMADIEALGEVKSAETETEDVTDELVDLEARLENLRAERDRLRELYDEANETQDVLAVQRELTDVQEEIERLEARQQSLERDVAFSTIRVELTEQEPEPPEPETEPAWYETSVLGAFLQSVAGVGTTLRALVVAGAYAAPYALVFGTPLVGAAALLRYRTRKD